MVWAPSCQNRSPDRLEGEVLFNRSSWQPSLLSFPSLPRCCSLGTAVSGVPGWPQQRWLCPGWCSSCSQCCMPWLLWITATLVPHGRAPCPSLTLNLPLLMWHTSSATHIAAKKLRFYVQTNLFYYLWLIWATLIFSLSFSIQRGHAWHTRALLQDWYCGHFFTYIYLQNNSMTDIHNTKS